MSNSRSLTSVDSVDSGLPAAAAGGSMSKSKSGTAVASGSGRLAGAGVGAGSARSASVTGSNVSPPRSKSSVLSSLRGAATGSACGAAVRSASSFDSEIADAPATAPAAAAPAMAPALLSVPAAGSSARSASWYCCDRMACWLRSCADGMCAGAGAAFAYSGFCGSIPRPSAAACAQSSPWPFVSACSSRACSSNARASLRVA